MEIRGNTILITGGTSGIGHGLAQEFMKRDNQVIVTGRRKSLVHEIANANPSLACYHLDVEDADSIQIFAEEVVADYPKLNVLVNNAGIMELENLTATTDDTTAVEAMVVINLLGPIRLIKSFLPHLRRQPEASIVNVSSDLAFVPLAAAPTYCATKAALHSYSISLRHQLQSTAIEVFEIIPPSVQTDLRPGHADDPNAMPLADFISESMTIFAQRPIPPEIKVKRSERLRNAEVEGRFTEAFSLINELRDVERLVVTDGGA